MLVALLTALSLSACREPVSPAVWSDPDAIVVSFPIDKAGRVVERDFQVTPSSQGNNTCYVVALKITYGKGDEPYKMIESADPLFRVAASRVQGGQSVPVAFEIPLNTAIDPGDNKPVHLARITATNDEASNYFFYAIAILNQPEPGTYHVRLEVLEDHPELSEIRSEIAIGRYISGK